MPDNGFVKHGLLYVPDGLTNALAGGGGSNDKRLASAYMMQNSAQEVDAAYRTSWIAKKIHDLPPFDETREWRNWKGSEEQINAIEAEEKRLKIKYKVRQARFLARLHGGAAMILGTPELDYTKPLDPAKLAKGGLTFVHVMAKHQITCGQLIADIRDPWYGLPQYYEISNANTGVPLQIHPSRIVPFIGQAVPTGSTSSGAGAHFWGDPLWMSLKDAVTNVDFTNNEIASMFAEAKIDVLRIPNLMEAIGTSEHETRFIRRLAAAQLGKSNHNALIMDAEEEYQQKQISFTGMPDVAKLMLLVASGASDIPATRLLGQSPAGLNATGESDLRNYYDSIGSKQRNELEPAIEPLDNALIASALGNRPSDIWYEWTPLWQLTPEQKADRDLKVAQTVTAYVNCAVIPNDAMEKAVQSRLIDDGVFPGLEEALATSDNIIELPGAENDNDEDPSETADERKKRVAANDAAPRSLYIHRDLINSAEFTKWAKGEGFTDIVDDLHVTIIYSRAAVDWMKTGESWGEGELTVRAGGPRMIDEFNGGAVVLLFSHTQLMWRNEELRRQGASADFEEYQPHITITYTKGDVDLSNVKPFVGELKFGPEIYSEIQA